MKKVSLQFNTKHDLLEFLGLTQTFRCLIDLEELTITAELSEAEIELAINGFHSKLIKDDSAFV